MKHKLLILLVMLLPLAAMSQGRLYKQYASRPGLTVAELNNFKLNDSTTVNVVLVRADNDQAWRQLKLQLDVRGTEGSDSWLGTFANPATRTRWTGTPVMRVVASHSRRTVGFYRIDTEAQYDALIDYQLNNMKQ